MAADFSRFRAALLDLDGTLIETHIDFPALTQAMQQMAQRADVPKDVTAGKDILGMVDAAAEYLNKHSSKSLKESAGDAFRREAFARLEDMEAEGCADPRLLPGTHDFLTSLVERGVKVGIVTRNCRRVSIALLARFALPHHLLLTRDDVPHAKPNPEHLWEALRLLGEEPANSLMAGDHWMDVQAGVRAGCGVTLGVMGDHDADWFALCPPTATVRDFADAQGLFGIM